MERGREGGREEGGREVGREGGWVGVRADGLRGCIVGAGEEEREEERIGAGRRRRGRGREKLQRRTREGADGQRGMDCRGGVLRREGEVEDRQES